MRDFISLLRAEFGRALRRRAVLGLFLLALAMVIFTSWTNSNLANESRGYIAVTKETIRQIESSPGISSDQRQSYTASLRRSLDVQEGRIELLRKDLSSKRLHLVVLGYLGSGPGIALAVLLAATLYGAEFRWNYWATLVVHEPRRLRIVLAKFLVLFALLFTGLVLLLLLSYPIGALFARVHDIGPEWGWPSLRTVLDALGRSWLTTAAYAALAACTVALTRSSLAALGTVFAFVALDSLLVSKFADLLRDISPARQVADLFEQYPNYFGLVSYAWPVVSPFRRSGLFGVGQATIYPNPFHDTDPTASALILLAVLILSVLGAVLGMLRRDIPAS